MKLSSIFSDGMVLQRNQAIKIWGYEVKGSQVEIDLAGKFFTVPVREDGSFVALLPPFQAGGPYTLRIVETGEKRLDWSIITIRDVMVGDVWLISGQSNMELPVYRTFDLYEKKFSHLNQSNIRMFQVPQKADFHGPCEQLDGSSWVTANPVDVRNFSAAGFFFAENMYENNHVPIGLIHTAVGGAHVEAFLSEKGLLRAAEELKSTTGTGSCTCSSINDSCKYCYEELLSKDRDDTYATETEAMDIKRQEDWMHHLNETDEGIQKKWYLEMNPREYDNWNMIMVPGIWKGTKLGEIRGSIWLRRSVDIPKHWLGQEIRLILGTLVDGDETYVNGHQVGETGYRYPPRRYVIPTDVLHAGTNQITIRLISSGNPGGFITNKPYVLRCGEEEIDLTGQWRYHIGAVTEALEEQTFFLWKPTGLYHAMLYPVRRYGIKGVLFYQGESNDHLPGDYEILFRQMISDWRALFSKEDLPIIYVQLANFEGEGDNIGTKNWTPIREAQRKCLSISNTAMVSAIDIGEDNDLHPQNKGELGRRLALAARGLADGEAIEYMGPLIQTAVTEEQDIKLVFSHTGTGIEPKDGKLSHFEIVDAEGNVHQVSPEAVTGDSGIRDTLIIHVSGILNPRIVRYAWDNAPGTIDFYNAEGLPASPFSVEI